MTRPFRERRELLRSLFKEVPKRFTWVKSIDAMSNDYDTISEFFKSALDIKCEGIMVKVLDHHGERRDSVVDETVFAEDNEVEELLAKGKEKEKEKTEKFDKSDKSAGGGRRKALLATYEPDKRLEVC